MVLEEQVAYVDFILLLMLPQYCTLISDTSLKFQKDAICHIIQNLTCNTVIVGDVEEGGVFELSKKGDSDQSKSFPKGANDGVTERNTLSTHPK
jgi:hypothetical protein